MFLLVPDYPGCPGSKAVKRSLLNGRLPVSDCSFAEFNIGNMWHNLFKLNLM